MKSCAAGQGQVSHGSKRATTRYSRRSSVAASSSCNTRVPSRKRSPVRDARPRNPDPRSPIPDPCSRHSGRSPGPAAGLEGSLREHPRKIRSARRSAHVRHNGNSKVQQCDGLDRGRVASSDLRSFGRRVSVRGRRRGLLVGGDELAPLLPRREHLGGAGRASRGARRETRQYHDSFKRVSQVNGRYMIFLYYCCIMRMQSRYGLSRVLSFSSVF